MPKHSILGPTANMIYFLSLYCLNPDISFVNLGICLIYNKTHSRKPECLEKYSFYIILRVYVGGVLIYTSSANRNFLQVKEYKRNEC